VLPSSHCSPGSRMPSPQEGTVQLFLQLSLFIPLPSSHCSDQGCCHRIPVLYNCSDNCLSCSCFRRHKLRPDLQCRHRRWAGYSHCGSCRCL
jgi:hypothetical protein